MRYLLLFSLLLLWKAGSGQGSGFSFNYSGPSQVIVGPDCEAPLDWGHPNTPTAMSNIPGGMIVSFTIYSISGGYSIGDMIPGGTTVTVFYQALDNFGNTALFGFTISFIDVLPPVFDPFSLPSNITISCITNVPPPADVEATDNCDNDNANLTITFTENNNAQLCTGGTITRTWVADDDLGNTATFIHSITVLQDNTPPVIANNLQNGTAPCSTAMAQYTIWLNAQRAAFSATDNGCGLMSLSDNAPAPAIITSFCGDINVTFTATDNCNNSSSVVRTFTITNNVPPVITTPASDASGNCSQNNIGLLFNNWINTQGGSEAEDDCSSVIWTTFPPAPSIHDTCDAAIEVMFIAGDGCNNFDTTMASFVLTDDTPPAFTSDPSTMILGCNAAGIDSTLLDWLVTGGNSTAHDLCTVDNDLSLGYRIGGMELSLVEVLDAWQDSLLSGCQDNVMIGGIGINNVLAYLPVQFTYTDNCENEAGKTGFFGITDNGRPEFVNPPVDTSFACSQSSNWEDVFLGWFNTAGGSTYMDLCSEVTVQTSITADSAIQYLTAALDTACLQGVSVAIAFGLTDACGNTSLTSPSATFSLQDTVPPILIVPAMDFIAACSENAQELLQNWMDTLGGAVASDGCGELMWEFSWMDTSGMTITGVPNEGPYPGLTDLDCAGSIEVVFTAYDICQNSVSDTALFSIIDTLPPVILIEEDSIHLNCLDTIPATIPEVVDSCDDQPLLSYTDSVGIDSCLGLPELVVRTWTAIDACGNSSTAQQWFFRIDAMPPTFELPSDTVAFCSIDTLFLVNVNDNCDPAPVTSWEDQLTGEACTQILTRTWTVTDACGNFSTAIQMFDLSDTSPPDIIYSPGHLIYACDTSTADLQTTYELWMDSVVIQDACSDAAYFIALRDSYILEDTATWPGTPVPDSIMLMCGIELTIEADLVAYDVCGNVMVEQISFSVNDTVGPAFIDCPGIMVVKPDTITCDAIVTLIPPSFEEVCFPDDVKLLLSINGGDTIPFDTILSIDTLLPVGIHTVIWIASDCNNNIGTCTISLQIIDENALTLFCPPDTLLFTDVESCQVELAIAPPETITASCGTGVMEWSGYIEGIAEPSSFVFDSATDIVLVTFSAGLHRVFLVAQDSTGDRDTCFYDLELRDTFPPEMLCQPDTLFLHPSGLENIAVASRSLLISAIDACGIDTVWYAPDTVNCSNNGQNINITITAVDQNGNAGICETTLYVATRPLMPLWESHLCDDTLRLFANLPEGPDVNYTFSWTGPNSFLSTDENPVIPDADSSHSGQYLLTVQSENGCVSTGVVEVVVQELIAPVISVSEDTLCTGEEVILSTQSFSGDVIYQWFHVLMSGDTLLSNTSEPLLTYIPEQAGVYTVYAVVSQDTCTSEPGPPVDFVVVSAPVADILTSSMILCATDTLFLTPVMVFDSLQYVWSGPSGYEAHEPSPPGIPANELDSSAVFFLTVSNAYCSSLPDSLEVNVQLPPPTPMITGDTIVCEGGTFVLSTQSSHQSYEWLDPLGNSIITVDDSLMISPAVMDQSGGWRVIAFENGCPSDTSDAFIVQVDTAIQIEIVAPSQVCQGDSITLSIIPSVMGDYVWSGPAGFVSNQLSPTTLAVTGTYHASVLTTTGCAAEDSLQVSVDVLPEIFSLMTDADSCVNGMSAITIWAETQPPFNGAFAYVWEGPSVFVQQDSSIVLDSATSAVNGIYTLVINNGTCTSETASITLTVTDSPAQPIITGENVYCFGDSIILSIESPLAGGLYSWTSQDTNVVIPSPGTLIIPNATTAWTGVYRVGVTIAGCTSATAMIAVQVRAPLFAPSIISPPLVCEGDSLVLIASAPPGVTFHWIGSNGFESMDERPVIYPVLPQDAGTYQVFYILNGCPSPISNPYDIEVQPTVTPPTIEADITTVCIDDPVAIQLCVTPGTLVDGGTYTWILDGTDIIGTPGMDSCITIEGSPLHGGLNNIIAFASLQGCPSDHSSAVLIQGDLIPDQTADAGPDAEFCPGEIILLNATGPLTGSGAWTSSDEFVVLSDDADPHAEVIGLPSGMYVLNWTLSYASCTNYSMDSVTISVLVSPETFPDTIEVPFGQTKDFLVTLNDLLSASPFTFQIIMNPQRGNALHVGNGLLRYTPNIGFVGTDMLIYRICSTDCPEECSESVVILRVGNEDDCFVPSLFTPNEDGINDRLIVPCLETSRFPQNKIIIFNEWGDVVYTASPYQNDWDGTVSGKSLPVGTYFYIMDFKDGSMPKRSFLILER
jgi:gliding motility-associated-like protein